MTLQMNTQKQALSGLRICDFTGQLAGAGATKWLAAFGAEVIRIEDPVRQGRWDILRGNPPFAEGQSGLEYGGGFNNHNTDKLGITLNLRTDAAKTILSELVAVSDAVTENFAAGVLDSWGFGYEQLKAIKHDIVYVSNCGFGHTGPYHSFKTWGPIVQAISGLTHTCALPDQPPAGWGYSYMDHTGAYYMAMAIMLALLHRKETGQGQWVDLACTETATTLSGPAILDWTVNGQSMRDKAINANRNQFQDMAPHGIYPCLGDDEWIAISVRHDQDWQALVGLINQPWTEAYTTLDKRLADADALDQQLGQWCATQDKLSLQAKLRALPIPAAAVQRPRERINSDAQASFGTWAEVEHSKMGRVRVDGQPARLSKTPWQSTRGAPCLSEHTRQVLTSVLNYSDAEVDRFIAEGVV